MTVLARTRAVVNDRPVLSSERMLRKDYDHKLQMKKKSTDRECQGACRQDELIGGKQPVVK
jgi:hypothetical protein